MDAGRAVRTQAAAEPAGAGIAVHCAAEPAR